MPTDLRGSSVSNPQARSLELYELALAQFQSYVGDPLATIDTALQEQDDFVLGHIFKAAVLMCYGEKRFANAAEETLRRGERYLSQANSRERGLYHAVSWLQKGDWERGVAGLESVLVDEPRDALAIQVAHLFDFYRGDSLNLRNRVARILPHWSPQVPSFSYIRGMYAFGLEECNQYAEAFQVAQQALELEPRDAWAVHAATHVFEMQGRIEEGIYWLESRAGDWAPENGFAYHNWWHLALFFLDRGDISRVLQLFDEKIYDPQLDLSLMLVDATALLWRLRLLHYDIGERGKPLAQAWREKLEAEKDFYAFNDVHALLAFILADDEASLNQLVSGIDSMATRPLAPTAAMMMQKVGQPLVRGLLAYRQGRWDAAVEALIAVRDQAHIFGGSHAQRDIITLTLIAAGIEGGRQNLARHYLADRMITRPGSALGWRLQASSFAGAGA